MRQASWPRPERLLNRCDLPTSERYESAASAAKGNMKSYAGIICIVLTLLLAAVAIVFLMWIDAQEEVSPVMTQVYFGELPCAED